MSEDDELKNLKLKRGITKGHLTRFETFISDVTNHNKIEELHIRLQRLDDAWLEFERIQSEIDILLSDSDILERQSFEDKYFKLVASGRHVIVQHKLNIQQQNANTLSNMPVPSNINVKLPLINLPNFNGTYEGWLPFYEGFKALVLDNSSLNNIQRFYYLLSCLKNDSVQVIQALEVSNDNFDIAWELLRDRYENPRVIVHSHVKGIFELPTMQKENHFMLRKIIDTFLKHFRSLKSLGQPVEHWDTLIIYILNNKLDNQTKREWESSIKSNNLPDLTTFIEFLKNKAQILETLDTKDCSKPFVPNNRPPFKQSIHIATDNVSETLICAFCQDAHVTYRCQKLLTLSPKIRYIELRKLKICCNCLKIGHYVDNCRSDKSCRMCKKRHNTALHSDNYTTNNHTNIQNDQNKQPEKPKAQERVHVSQQIHSSTHTDIHHEPENQNHALQNTTLLSNADHSQQILLSTVQVYIYDINNQPVKCRALLDSGSQSNFITSDLLKTLKLQTLKVDMPITGINQAALNINKKTQACIQSIDKGYNSSLSFLVIDQITGKLPQLQFDPSLLNIPDHIQMSDPHFHKPGKINMLIGSSIFYSLLTSQRFELGENCPVLQHTKLGWIIAGPLDIYHSTNYLATQSLSRLPNNNNCLFTYNSDTLHNQVERFWQVENISSPHAKLSNEELECEIHFREHFEQDSTGRCTVQLPLNEKYNQLGDSFTTAVKRLKSMETKLSKDKNLHKQYHEFLQEYEDLGHMSKVNTNLDNPNDIHNYLPHHAVIKESSTTTRVRVVFDASSKTSTGLSLNDVQKIGPTIQEDLFGIIIRMRTFNIVITADITKMYRQINIHESHRNLQRIIWRKNPDSPIDHYILNTITYGTASASFLATRTLHQVGLNVKDSDPIASEAILNNFYMDDLICGASNIDEAKQLKTNIEKILLNSRLPLRKWLSNKPEIFDLPAKTDEQSSDHTQYVISDTEVKTLGIIWNPQKDIFSYSVKCPDTTYPITKRSILSNIASLFDPLCLIGPCIVKAKLLLQQLWQRQINWDDPVPVDIQEIWVQFLENLKYVCHIQIPRHVIVINPIRITLHGFSDSSEAAYGACIYLASQSSEGKIYSSLVCAKSRLAPLKVISLPRLELCGALLLAQLMDKVKHSLNLDIQNTFFWTDSTIVLAWLASQPNKWKAFVSNRVSEIQDLTAHTSWRHVKSEENPADIISRGLDPQPLSNCSLWWQGPLWLSDKPENWPQKQIVNIDGIPEARKEKITLTYHSMIDTSLVYRYSNFSKLQRVTAYILRFLHNSKNKGKITGPISGSELNTATLRLCKIVQNNEFQSEITLLQQSKPVHKNSKLISLNPFLDSEGIIRVGGRLKNANITFSQKHPVVLPGKHTLTRLLILHEHHKSLHAGVQFILSRLRTQFWPINGRNSVRSVLRTCLTCFKAKPISVNQLMGDLPEPRVTPSRPFTYCGIDYAGFYNIKDATKAVHVELVTDLTTDGFMNAFKRFVSRRGLCKHIYTDNGTNFVGASNDLKKICEILNNIPVHSKFASYFNENTIQWHFIPARSPHFGGIWEAAVKSFKHHMKRVVTDTNLTFEDFYTVLTQIEAILNSRPLLPLSNDPQDLYSLTPGHFLIGDALVAVPQEKVDELPVNRLTAYKKLQQMIQRFWTSWSTDYLNTLQQRSKWRQDSSNIVVGTMVLLKEDHLPPMNWQLARVVEVYPGQDSKVRVVSVRTNSSVIRRAIHKICPLPQTDLMFTKPSE